VEAREPIVLSQETVSTFLAAFLQRISKLMRDTRTISLIQQSVSSGIPEL
jgi:hypothetical protein